MNAHPHPMSKPQRASLLRTVKAVAWAFLGIRKKSEFQDDMGKINPVHIVVVALLGVALFVGSLVLLVKWIVGA
jgi:hypothetical protein